jgi:phage terminase small subunit
MTWGPAGVILKPSSELTDEQAAAVESIAETHTAAGSGTTKVTLHGKLKALELGAKLLRMTEEDDTPKGPITITIVYEDKRAINSAKD